MSRKVPVLKLINPKNWSRIHPLTALFFIVFTVFLIGIANTSLRFLIVPALIVIVLYLVFLWKFIEKIF